MRARLAFFCLLLLAVIASAAPARADDGPVFHRTTPRAALDAAAGTLVIGVPGGRAWGVESDLRPLPPSGTALYVRLRVGDPAVRETFVRVAYYAAPTGRTRQLAVADSEPVPAGRSALVAVPLEPPAGAVAYRVRVLARLAVAGARSADDAISARVRALAAPTRSAGMVSRLLP